MNMTPSVVTAWLGDSDVEGFVFAPGFLWGQILYRLQKALGWDYRTVVNVFVKADWSHPYLLNSVVHVRVLWIMEATKVTQHAQKVSGL